MAFNTFSCIKVSDILPLNFKLRLLAQLVGNLNFVNHQQKVD